MPETPARRRSVATLTSATVIGASVAVLLVSPVSTTLANAAVAPGSTLRASVKSNGDEARTGGFENTISADGRWMAFVSTDQLDDLPTNGRESVYVRDLVNKNRTVMISRGQFTPQPPPTGGPGFSSGKLLNLSAQPSTPERAPDGQNFEPTISEDGRFVAFRSTAHNIVSDGSVNQDIIVVDRDPDGDGIFDEDLVEGNATRRDYAYHLVNNPQPFGSVSEPKLDAKGTRIVWHEVSCPPQLFCSDVLNTRLLDIGVPDGDIQTVRPDLGGQTFVFGQFDPAISGDGKHIVMHAEVNPCDCGQPDFHAIVSYNTETGESTRVDIDSDLKTPISENFEMFVMHPSVNRDGTVITFTGEQFTDNDGSFFSSFNQPNVYAVQVNYTAAQKVTSSVIASRNNAGALIDGARSAVSADGRYVVFETDSLGAHDGADGSVHEDDTSCIRPPQVIGLTGSHMLDFAAKLPPERKPNPRTSCQIVMRDLVLDRSDPTPRLQGTLISVNKDGAAGRFDSFFPSISRDGSKVGFDSDSLDLLTGPDANETTDAFWRTLTPGLQADPSSLKFDTVQLNQSANRSVQLSETGQGPLVIDQFTVEGPNKNDFALDPGTCIGNPQVLLHQGTPCRVSVSFSPKATGARNGTLVIRFRGSELIRVPLNGIGGEPPKGPAFSNNPTTLDFGQRLLLSSGPEQTVTVTNIGDQPMTITAVKPAGAGAPGDYAISTNTCLTSLAPNAQCQVSVRFSPSLPGDRPAVLQFTDNAPGGPHLVGLRGQGGLMTITVNPGIMPGGRVTSVIGAGFPPGKSVTITFQQRPGQSTATVAADGTFRASLLVFPKASPETRTVVATVDGSPALFTTTPLLIVFDTVKPADFVIRH